MIKAVKLKELLRLLLYGKKVPELQQLVNRLKEREKEQKK